MRQKKTHLTWRRDEVDLLVQNIDATPNELVQLFPTRSYFSILSKRNKIVRINAGTEHKTQVQLNLCEEIYLPNEAIDDIHEILNQSLVKVEELTIENSKLNTQIKKLEEELSNVNDRYESQKGKVEALASESKSKWSLIKKVFF